MKRVIMLVVVGCVGFISYRIWQQQRPNRTRRHIEGIIKDLTQTFESDPQRSPLMMALAEQGFGHVAGSEIGPLDFRFENYAAIYEFIARNQDLPNEQFEQLCAAVIALPISMQQQQDIVANMHMAKRTREEQAA